MVYRMVKLSTKSYMILLRLKRHLETQGVLPGIEKLTMSEAVGYAATKALQQVQKKR